MNVFNTIAVLGQAWTAAMLPEWWISWLGWHQQE